MAILGLILVLLFGGLRLAVRSWDATQQKVDILNAVRSVEGFLRREMTAVHPYRWKNVLGRPLAFVGERTKLNFVAQLPTRIGGGGLYAISVELEQTGDTKRLVWRHLPVNAQMQDFSELSRAEPMVLAAFEIGDIEDIWLSYFGREGESAESRWMDRWENTTRLPALIRIQVKLAHDAQWPDFVVAPMLASEGGR